MKIQINSQDLLWQNISELPYFRGFLRSIEGKYFREFEIKGKVLDLGCGDGHFSSKTLPDITIQGIDPSFKSLQSAKGLNYYSGVVCSVGNYLPFKEASFDSVISNSVLEHIPDVDSVIHDAIRVLKSGGKLIITVPNSKFTKNLSIALFFDRLGFKGIANVYRRFFNWISRHYHPDAREMWLDRLTNQGLFAIENWDYFSPEYLRILEWGHLFGLPAWLNFKIFGRWVLFPNESNNYLKRVYMWLYPYFAGDSKSLNGAYTFIVAKKQ